MTTYKGTAPILPSTVTAVLGADATKQLQVKWDAIAASKYAAIGKFTVEEIRVANNNLQLLLRPPRL